MKLYRFRVSVSRKQKVTFGETPFVSISIEITLSADDDDDSLRTTTTTDDFVGGGE